MTQLEKIQIRPYRSSDLESLYKICLLTGDSGKDASHKYKDPKLLGHFYAAPYAIIEPELTFIVTLDEFPSGYILGTKDSQNFHNNSEAGWFPELRQKYIFPDSGDTSADANIIRLIHQGYILKEDLEEYPAHLHIDLLPSTQGKGLGRKLINTFVEKLRVLEVSGLHLEVGRKNPKAIEFYKRMGFHIIKEYEHSIAFGYNLINEKI
jgi:ribosomal protein S18 acetylase RimI-like enzyme